MKKYIIVILIMLYCIIDTGTAKAVEYEKTIDYRYRFIGYDGNWYQGAWTTWRQDRDFNFTDNNTDTLAMTNSNYGTTTITCVDLVSSSNGTLYFKGQKVAGGAGNIMLSDMTVDYIYKYIDNTVDTDYTFTITLEKPNNYRYNWCKVYIYGINRLDGSYTQKKQIFYKNTADHQYDEYAWTESYTYEGSDGYNYSGFCIRVDMQVVNEEVYLDNTMYELWKYTSSLDTYTPEVNVGEQLDNINGTLGSIYSSITSGLSSVTTAITNLPTTIITGIKNLFIYDDWQEDVEDINSQVSVPFVTDITNSFTSIMSAFTSYNPYYQETLRCPNLMTSSPQYLFSVDLDLSRILGGNAIGNYKWIDLIRIATSFGSFAVYYSIIRKLLLKLGIDINDFVSPIIRKVGNV